jgi:hypothetical protein
MYLGLREIFISDLFLAFHDELFTISTAETTSNAPSFIHVSHIANHRTDYFRDHSHLENNACILNDMGQESSDGGLGPQAILVIICAGPKTEAVLTEMSTL